MYVCATCICLVYTDIRRGFQIHSRLGVTRDCEPPCRCWEFNLGPLQVQPVLLTAGPSLQCPFYDLELHFLPFTLGFIPGSFSGSDSGFQFCGN